MDWNDLRYVLTLARLRSVRAAGKELGVSHSTVARRIEALEEELSARLFDRSRDGYTLTEAGAKMLPTAERIELEMAALERDLMGADERLAGPVRLTCCDEFVSAVMLRGLATSCRAYPQIELGITTDTRAYNLAKREADIAIRAIACGEQPPEQLVARKLVPVVICNYVGKEHAQRLDPERAGGDTRWVAFDERSMIEMMIADGSYPDVPPWGWFSSLGLALQAAREGLGIAMLPTYVADPDPGVERLPRADLRHMADLWLLYHPDLRENARLQAMRQCVAETLMSQHALFSGESADVEGRARSGPNLKVNPPEVSTTASMAEAED